MHIDRFGTALSTLRPLAADHVEDATRRLLSHRPDVDAALARAIDVDAHCVGAHALRGLCQVLQGRAESNIMARSHLARAEVALGRAGASHAETSLLLALRVGVHGGLRAAAEICESHLRHAPDSVLLAKLAHGLRFMAGDSGALATGINLALEAVSPDAVGYGYLVGCQAFALEERGDYGHAERLGRFAVDMNPADAWATHAVGHVHEMTGRAEAGLRWVKSRQGFWNDCNNFALHLHWHAALFHLELGQFDAALDLYDTEIWPRASDDFRDLGNAISLLSHLNALGIPTGDRWQAVAELADARRRDVTYCFASLHYLIALLADGRVAQASDLVEAMERPSLPGNEQERVLRQAARPLARLLFESAVGRMRKFDVASLLTAAKVLGGSNAQRDVFVVRLSEIAASNGDLATLSDILSFRRRLKSQGRFEATLQARLQQASTAIRFTA